MLISVVTAVYNRADTVGEAVESLRSQTWTDYEHVIQDGGSTDGTLDVLGRLADERTRLVSGRDSGIYDALNRGLARTTGEVVGLLHSDDLGDYPADTSATRSGAGGAGVRIWAEGRRGLREPPEVSPARTSPRLAIAVPK